MKKKMKKTHCEKSKGRRKSVTKEENMISR